MRGKTLSKVAVIGTGGIGGYYGGLIAKAGRDVIFIGRSDVAQIRLRGLEVRSEVAESFHLDPVEVSERPSQVGVVDLVVIATKTTGNAEVAEWVKPLVGDNTAILTLQNGLGNDVFFGEKFPNAEIFGGLCFVCLNRIEPGVIHHIGQGHVTVGSYRGRDSACGELVDQLCESGIQAKAVENLAAAQWRKLFWNIPFNGLAVAKGGVDCAEILSRARDKVERLMREVHAVAAALGYDIGEVESLVAKQIEVTKNMGAYRPSSLLDYEAGRGIELDAIWRLPLERAGEVGVEVPEMRSLLEALEAYQAAL